MDDSGKSGRVPQDLGAGIFLVALALLALWQSMALDPGTLTQMGPGMLPRALATLTGACGVLIAVRAFLSRHGEKLVGASLRGGLFVLGAALVFALTIRPLGFVVAGPCALLLASFASRETRPVEAVIFAAVMTALCTALFRLLLGLPIPVAPWFLGY